MTEFSTLIAAARAGDRAALDQLYRDYAGPVVAAVRRRLSFPLRRQFDTMDLAQSVFLEVLRDLPTFTDMGEPAFRGWLRLKVRSKIGMKLRRHLGEGGARVSAPLKTEAPSPGRTPSSHAAAEEDRTRMRDLLDSLPEEDRRLLLLRLDSGLKFEEIAARLGLPSAEAARKRYARGLDRIRRMA